MRILLISHEFSMSGASVNLLKVADHLVRAGHDCALLPSLRDTGPIEAEYARRGIPILREAACADFTVAICNTLCTGAAVSLAARDTRTIWWIHEAECGLEYVMQRPAIAHAFREASAIVLQHDYYRDNIYRSFLYSRDPSTVFVISNGYSVARTGATVPKTHPIRVIAVGTIDERKRQGDLIQALAKLDRPDIECVFVGRPVALGDAEQRIARAAPDRFRFMGELPHEQTLAWMRSSDICCLPSGSESQPNALFEGALTGNALVATDLPAHRGIWRNGENALLHPVGDVEALARAIGRLADDAPLRRRLADAAAMTAAEFTEERLFANIDRVLAAACA
jgi:glycosyltransferase involved in cell wall biosynthesis